MSETEVRDYLERLTGPLPVRPAPVREVREAARNRRTRRWGVVAAAGLAVAGLVTAGGMIPMLSPSQPSAEPKPSESPTDGLPSAGVGMRWVGYGRAVVAVPSSWATVTAPCRSPRNSHVYLSSRDVTGARCLARGHQGHQVTLGVGSFDEITDLDGGWGLGTPVLDDGVRVQKSDKICGFSAKEPGCTLEFAVPSQDAHFVLGVTGSECCIDAIRDSLTILPEGFTTVPWVVAGANVTRAEGAINAAGLAVENPTTTYFAEILKLIPASGTVVATGSTVRVVPRPER